MALATWWTTDPLPDFPPLAGFSTAIATDDAELAHINRLAPGEVLARRTAGHRPYIVRMDGAAAAYGWVATASGSIGELRLTFSLPPGQRYLWDFATLPGYRGRGLYPRLLQAILEAEAVETSRGMADRFWIIHAPENLPSGAGMSRAGFLPVGQLSFRLDGSVGLVPYEAHARAAAGASLLGVPLVDTVLSPCWHCGMAVEQMLTQEEMERCWPPLAPLANGSQTCGCATPLQNREQLAQNGNSWPGTAACFGEQHRI